MPTSIRPGDELSGRYRLVDLLDERRGGRFFRAEDLVLTRSVAVHVIGSEDERGPALMEAARRSARVHDQRILRVLDTDQSDGVCWVVNEWGSGRSLDIILSDEGPMAPRRAAWLTSEVAAAVAVAHDSGVAHGRLVPENVLVDQHGGLRIIGLAVDAALHGLPEGRRSADVTDLGGILYAALTGRWAGISLSAVEPALTESGRVLRPRRVRAGIPRLLDQVCDEILNGAEARTSYDLGTARGIHDALAEFVGDPAGLAEAEAARSPAPMVPSIQPADETGDLPVTGPTVDDRATRPAGDDHPARPDRDEDLTQAKPSTPTAAAPGAAGSAGAGAAGAAVGATGAAGPVGAVGAAGAAGSGRAEPDQTVVESPARGPAGDDGPDPAAVPEDVSPDPADAATDGPAAGRGRAGSSTDRPGSPAGHPDPTEIPTQAGMPVFDDERDQVAWIAARSEKPPPPPPLEEPPARPLFAPEPPEGRPQRTPRAGAAVAPSRPADEYWPWESSGTGSGTGTGAVPPYVDDEVPGRSWLRLAMVVGLCAVLLLAGAVVYNLNTGGTPLGLGEGDEPSESAGESAAPRDRLTRVRGLTATDLDPQGDTDEENPEQAPLAVDGDPTTAWQTLTYDQDFGPAGLKTGLGLVVDLGEVRAPRRVGVVVAGETDLELYLSSTEPSDVTDLDPIATATGAGNVASDLSGQDRGRYLVVWLTSLPATDDGRFRGEVAEIVVRE